MENPLDILVENKDFISIIHVSGIITMYNQDILKKVFKEELEKELDIIAFNAKNIIQIDSSTINMFFKFAKDSIGKSIKLVIYDLNPHIKRLFNIAQLNKFFMITSKNDFYTEFFNEY